jgi:hypothetical protein
MSDSSIKAGISNKSMSSPMTISLSVTERRAQLLRRSQKEEVDDIVSGY